MFHEYDWARRQKALFRDYAAVIVASQHMKDEYARNGMDEGKLHVNPLFPTIAPPEDETPVMKAEPLRVLFLGRMTKLKGGDLLVRAVAEASERLGRKIHLVMAGEGPQRAAWERLATRLHVQADFPGWVTGEEHLQLLKRTSLLAVPSLWPEPFGLVGLEAACFGVPAIAFDVGGIREWLRDGVNGFLVGCRVPNSKAFADGLVRALAQPEQVAGMRHAARATALEMSLHKHLDGVETVLAGACCQNLNERSRQDVSII
jgi:glycosyltransferase involved in cell wall biosynthesis